MVDFKHEVSKMIGMKFGSFYPSFNSLSQKYSEESSKTVNGFDYKNKQEQLVAMVEKHKNNDGSVTLSIYDNIQNRKYSTKPYSNGYSTDNTPFVEIKTDNYVIYDTGTRKGEVDKQDEIMIIETGKRMTLGEYLDTET